MMRLHGHQPRALRRAALFALAALSSAGAAFAQAAPGSAWRDPFQDGSGRRGPEMVAVPGGSFLMGSLPRDPEYHTTEVPHAVELSGFALGRYEVTWEEIADLLNEEGNDDGGVPRVDLTWEGAGLRFEDGVFRPAPGAARLPVTGISWRGALAYAEWLSEKTGESYTLPTEAQWEWAARAGTDTVWPWGHTFDSSRLNCSGGPEARLDPVGSHPPDARGIHDLLGNVWEWTLDCFSPDFYFYAPVREPRLLDPCCLAPGIRGGSFRDPAGYCRPGYRINFWWRGFPEGIGFRVARRLERR